MPKRIPKISGRSTISLLLVEGDTEVLFYDKVKRLYLAACRVKIHNMEGLRNINTKVLDCITRYCRQHQTIRAYCCLDRESRGRPVPDFDLDLIRNELLGKYGNAVLSVDAIIATQQIESWFFHDLEGIYRFLEMPKGKRNVKAFKPVEKYGYKQLQNLFEQNGKTYAKGCKAENFINHLNIAKIVSCCKDLKQGIALIQKQTGL